MEGDEAPADRPLYFTVINMDCALRENGGGPGSCADGSDDPGCQAGRAMAAVSHELVEAATDPLPPFSWANASSAAALRIRSSLELLFMAHSLSGETCRLADCPER